MAAERPTGLIRRQLVFGDNVDLNNVQAGYDAGMLCLTIPVAVKAKPRKIEVAAGTGDTEEPATPS